MVVGLLNLKPDLTDVVISQTAHCDHTDVEDAHRNNKHGGINDLPALLANSSK